MVDLNKDGKDDETNKPIPTFLEALGVDPNAPAAAPLAAAPPADAPPVVTPPPLQEAQRTVIAPTTTTKATETVTRSPESKTTTTTPEVTTKGKVQTPQELELLKSQTGLDQEALDLQKKQGAIAVESANYKAQQAEEAKTQAAAKATELKTVTDAATAEAAKRTAEYDARYDDYKKIKYEDFWEKKGTGTQILAAISIGLGAFAQGISGGAVKENTALKIIQSAIDQDFERQKATVAKGKETVGLAKEGIELARQTKADQLNDLDLKYAAATESVAAKYASMLAKQGIPQAEIDSNKVLLGLRQAAQDKKLKVAEDLRQEITNVSQKVVSEKTSGGTTVTSGGGSTTSGGLQTVYKTADKLKPKLTEGQNTVDKEFGKTYEEYFASGGSATSKKHIDTLTAALAAYQKDKIGFKGKVFGALAPDAAKTLITPERAEIQDKVKGVAQMSIRQILGPQFTEKEGVSIMERAFNPGQSQENNIARLKQLRDELKEAANAKDKAVEYFQTYGTLTGFKGKVYTGADILAPEDKKGVKEMKAKDAGASSSKSAKKEVKRQTSPSTGKIKIIYDDGSEEIQ